MKTSAIIRNVHVSSRKGKLVVDLIRGKKVNEALRILETTNKKSAPIIKKLLNSAIANAMNNHGMNASALYVYEIFANEGPTMRRVMPRAKGSADSIHKRTTHFQIVLSDDPAERQKDLLAIKEKIAKRARNNSKEAKDAKLASKTSMSKKPSGQKSKKQGVKK